MRSVNNPELMAVILRHLAVGKLDGFEGSWEAKGDKY
jgi:hypothetical protein